MPPSGALRKQRIGRLNLLPQPPVAPGCENRENVKFIQLSRIPIFEVYIWASCVYPTIHIGFLCLSNYTYRPPWYFQNYTPWPPMSIQLYTQAFCMSRLYKFALCVFPPGGSPVGPGWPPGAPRWTPVAPRWPPGGPRCPHLWHFG